jgi:hypothetical protein
MAKRRRAPDRRNSSKRAAPDRPAAAGGARATRGQTPSAGSPRRRPGWPIALGGGLIVVVLVAVFGRGLGAIGASSTASAAATSTASSTATSSPTSPAAATASPAGASGAPGASGASGASGAPVISGIACDVDEGTTYHVHAHLNIRIDGVLREVPAGIGILPTCLYWLHTHAAFGVIHVEAPAAGRFTLGQFFDLWGKPLSSGQVLDRTVGPGESLFMYVDRQPYQGDPRTIELGDLVAIELQVGPAALEPLPYTFPPDLQ